MAAKHVDVEGLVTEWAWDYFRRKATSEEKKLLDKELIRVEIDWKRVKFAHQKPSFEPEPPKVGSGTPKVGILLPMTDTRTHKSASVHEHLLHVSSIVNRLNSRPNHILFDYV